MKALPAVAVLLLVAACQTAPPEMTEAAVAQVEAEVTKAIADRWDGFRETIQAGDYEGWATYWTSDTRLLQPGMDLSGTAWFDSVRDYFGSGVQFLTFDVESFEVFVHGGVAFQIGQYDETATLGDGEPAEWHEYFFARWEKGTDGIWRISRLLSAPKEAPPAG